MPRITFRLTNEELESINQKADECGITRSQYIRQVAIGIVPRSKLDKKIIHQLFLFQGDIGRLGGLFKMWLSRNEDIFLHQKLNIVDLIKELNQLKDSINQLIKKL